MKKHILLTWFAVLSFSLQAQQIMIVKTKDNTQNEFNVNSIRKITFRSSLEIPGDSTVSLSCPDEHHPHPIDLGLPSGTKWACCNVEASTPDDYGGYYAWGETEEKLSFDWENYRHYDSSTEQCIHIGDDIAGTEYDVATVKWGDLWRLPSSEMFQELMDNCTFEWTSLNDVNGYLFTGSNGGRIFLPAAGGCLYDALLLDGRDGNYWASTLDSEEKDNAFFLVFRSQFVQLQYSPRFLGLSVRPVCQ